MYLIGECGVEAQRPVALELGPHGHGGRGQHPRMAAVVVEVQLGMSVGAHSNHGPRVVPVAPQNIEALNEVSKGGSALRRFSKLCSKTKMGVCIVVLLQQCGVPLK